MLNNKEFPTSFSEAAALYQIWKNRDPYPDIPSALLNSADILDYVRVTGMIYPFHEEDIKGATYSVRLKGMCVHFTEDSEGQIDPDCFCVGEDELDLPNAVENEKIYSASEKLVLKPNSITYVTLEPVFQVPEYLALRFNLKISHVYKGLLLGTGPIIDPGFQGRLSIPLHNLTSNEYVFDQEDSIIYLEITKMSPNCRWNGFKVRQRWSTYIPTEIPKHRQVDEYIREALAGNKEKHVVSSITAATNDVRKTADQAENTVKQLSKEIRSFTIVGALGIIIATIALIVALVLPTYQLVKSTTDTQSNYAQKFEEMEQEINDLRTLLNNYEN